MESLGGRTPTHKVLIYVSGHKITSYKVSTSSMAALIPPLQTGKKLCRHQCDFVVVSPSAVGDMSCMIIVVELKFGQVLASDANIPNGDGQDVATIRRQPGTDGCHCKTRQPIEWKRVEVSQQTYVCMTHGDEG